MGLTIQVTPEEPKAGEQFEVIARAHDDGDVTVYLTVEGDYEGSNDGALETHLTFHPKAAGHCRAKAHERDRAGNESVPVEKNIKIAPGPKLADD